jgi:hypothetical protein
VSLLARAVSALPDAALGVAFLVTWISPHAFGRGMLKYALVTMLLEFFIVHSSGFMSLVLWGMKLGVVRKTLAALGVGVGYTMLLVGFALAVEAWWPVWAFWGLTLNRLTSALLSPKGAGKTRTRLANDWVASGILYILWVFATIPPWVPALGITPDVVAAAGLPGTGPWPEEPYRVLVAGAGYFLCQAGRELSDGAFLKYG